MCLDFKTPTWPIPAVYLWLRKLMPNQEWFNERLDCNILLLTTLLSTISEARLCVKVKTGDRLI
jgi:hypothetical protein